MKYSIAIPAYKSKFLQECIISVLSQTYDDFELIIVNDASPERIDEIVSEFNDQRIKYFINNENCGAVNLVDNWNKCLQYASGDFFICMGDDDRLLPNCLEEYNKLISEYPYLNIYHGWTEIIDENSEIITMQEPRPLTECVYSMMWNRWKYRNQYIGDFLFRTDALKSTGGFYKLPLAWGSDDITTYIIAKDKGIANTQTPVFQYRRNSYTISSVGNSEWKLIALKEDYIWSKEFLKFPPSDMISKVYWENLCTMAYPRYQRRKRNTLEKDINNGGYKRLAFWFRNKEKYDINNILLLKLLICYLKNKTRNYL